MSPMTVFLAKLSGVKPNGRGWQARCPSHDDRNPSLSIKEGDDGRVLVHCHAGCRPQDIVAAVGLTMADLMPPSPSSSLKPKRKKRKTRVPVRAFDSAEACIAHLEEVHGSCSARWPYQNAEHETVGWVLRWNLPEGDKEIRPVSLVPEGWANRAMPTPRPLYRLPDLSAARLVVVTEGEKCAEAVREMGMLATTSSGGARAAGQSDWMPLAGKDIFILPDNDEAGRSYVGDVLSLLSKLDPKPTVRVVHLPGLAEGEDVYDLIQSRRTAGAQDDGIRAELENLVRETQPAESPEPSPLTWKPFPVDCLPEPIRTFVSTGARAIGCDLCHLALPLLSALAAAIGNSHCIELKRTWRERPAIWTIIVGESGSSKTPAFKAALEPVGHHQARLMKEFQLEEERYRQELLLYEAELKAWQRTAGKEGAGDPPLRPIAPEAVRVLVSDTTTEAIAEILAANPRGVLLARDELSGWIASFDRYAGKGGGDEAQWLEMHNGGVVVVDRKTGARRTIYVPSALVSITGGIQPGVLDRVMGVKQREDGLFARFLLACPPPISKSWNEEDIPEEVVTAVAGTFGRLYGLAVPIDVNGFSQPQVLTLTPAAKEQWVSYYNEHNREMAQLEGDLRRAWAKLEGYTARLALVLHLTRWAAGDPTADPAAVDETSMRSAITLTRWFGHEARRILGRFAETDDDRDQRQLVEWIERHGGSVTVNELTHKHWGYRGKTELARNDLNRLVEARLGRWDRSVPGKAGGRPAERFVLEHQTRITETCPETGLRQGFGDGDAGASPAMPQLSVDGEDATSQVRADGDMRSENHAVESNPPPADLTKAPTADETWGTI